MPEAEGEVDWSKVTFPLGGSHVQPIQQGYQPAGEPIDVSKVTPPQRPSPIAPSQTAAGQYSIYDWFRELYDGQQRLEQRVKAVETTLKQNPPPTENELLHRAAILLHNLGVKRGYPDQDAVAWLEQYRQFFAKEQPASGA